MKKIQLAIAALLIYNSVFSQTAFDEDQLGAWYMYFWNTKFNDGPWGAQGDIQYRNWNIAGDLEQLMLRGGLTYSPENANAKFTLGYANIQTGAFGDETTTTGESRIYQEALIPNKIGTKFYLTHRFRYEQRFVDDQDMRTRYRYFLTLSVPLNNQEMTDDTFYLALYNELFINGQRDTGNGSVELFDRNRFYTALGYQVKLGLKFQLGVMRQVTNGWQKNQLQLSMHHTW